MRNVGLLFNTQKNDAVKKAGQLCRWGAENNVNFILPEYGALTTGTHGGCDDARARYVEFAVVLGGDGTFLRAARYTFGRNIPLYGVNLGRLGFLATGSPETAEEDILLILGGKYTVQKRNLIKGILWRKGEPLYEMHALNDIVVSKGALARTIDLEVRTGKELLTLMIGDGLIISTPTGSTAYSLSAGGPIVPPHIPCLLLAPICSHSLYSRPIILGRDDKVYILPKGKLSNTIISQDGQLGCELMEGDVIEAALHPDMFVNTIQLEGRSYYDLLREKLRWGCNGISDGGKPV